MYSSAPSADKVVYDATRGCPTSGPQGVNLWLLGAHPATTTPHHSSYSSWGLQAPPLSLNVHVLSPPGGRGGGYNPQYWRNPQLRVWQSAHTSSGEGDWGVPVHHGVAHMNGATVEGEGTNLACSTEGLWLMLVKPSRHEAPTPLEAGQPWYLYTDFSFGKHSHKNCFPYRKCNKW